eukprot:CAMPEP_0173110650 /NCGR_PEP_ID=MMETSP1102-20130122/44518_1 /TAXON_ID=49646 /ORGANISM="Geminigera sp., Strain Caron Lab Isolate" /LENGTH=72 /DNA_ID=CAMNT_0014010509 /DNA_START=81 /DNA_END=296 /DNA_ORIENTATION=-
MNRQTGILPLSMSIVACILLVAASSASGTGVVPTGLQSRELRGGAAPQQHTVANVLAGPAHVAYATPLEDGG